MWDGPVLRGATDAHQPVSIHLPCRLPIILTWAVKANIQLKQLLIPLSFAALLGGTNTIIGKL